MKPNNPYPRPTTDAEIGSLEGVLYFVHERESVRLARAAGQPGPWTADPLLQRYRFTNVRRRDDRVTQWFIKHLIEPNLGRDDLWFTLLIARNLNWPPAMHALLDAGVIPCKPEEFSVPRFVEVLGARKAAGQKSFNAAYGLYPTRSTTSPVKAENVGNLIIGSAIKRAQVIDDALWMVRMRPSVERFVTALSGCFGIATFMAGQVAADLTYAHGHLSDAIDLNTYAPLGPGSQRGLNYMLGLRPKKAWKQEEFNEALMDLNAAISTNLGLDDLTLHDVQNVACEYGKYARAALGDIKPKMIYRPQTAY